MSGNASGDRPVDPALMDRLMRALDSATNRIEELEAARSRPIAIIGIGCRFPGGVDGPRSFWKLLENGADVVSDYPASRWDIGALYDPVAGTVGKSCARAGGWLSDVDRFDAAFFGITPREARALDPQQRILLEVAWDAFAAAGQPRDRLRGSRTGVFVGISNSDYGRLLARAPGFRGLDSYYITGHTLNAAAGRISYVFGLAGPCMAVDTACSSSLSALHLACQSLRSGDCDLALSAGVNLVLSPEGLVALSQAGVLSPDGRCRAFAAEANGMGRGEGCGAVVLKFLDQAIRDGDPIHAVIRGSAANQDGASGGLTVPNGPAQVRVIRDALAHAGLTAADVDYVEAHGTGTALGDPIEMQALGEAYGSGAGGARVAPLRVGSVKTNIAHGESSAGIAGLIKVALSLSHELIPPHLHAETLSPSIPWNELEVAVSRDAVPWQRSDRRRRAGLSGFGFSGSNVHVILEEAPERVDAALSATGRPLPLVLSAATPKALRDVAARNAAWLREHAAPGAESVAAWLACRTTHLAHRVALRLGPGADGRVAAAETLENFAANGEAFGVSVGRASGSPARPVFLFTGQGAQYFGMGRDLFAIAPVFRETLLEAEALLSGGQGGPERPHPERSIGERPLLERSLLDVLFRDAAAAPLLDRTEYTQPALYVFEVAMARLWRSLGVEPAALLGHSIGELAAATVAGIFSFADGLRLVAARGQLMQAIERDGAMTAVLAPEPVVRGLCDEVSRDALAIAAVNAPENVAVSGDREAVARLAALSAERGIVQKPLIVSHAFHSAHMDAMLEPFLKVARGITYHRATLPVISNATGERADAEMMTPEYWVSQVRSPVRFADGVRTLLASERRVFLEVGPHPVLSGFVRQCATSVSTGRSGGPELAVVAGQRRDENGADRWADAIGALHVAGVAVDWSTLFQNVTPCMPDPPTYPFQRERYWMEWDPLVEEHKLPVLRLAWRAIVPSALVPSSLVADPSGHESWVLVTPQGIEAWAEAFARTVAARGGQVAIVSANELMAGHVSFDGFASATYVVLATDAADESAAAERNVPDRVRGLLHAVASRAQGSARIWVVTRGGEAVAAAPVSPTMAAALGLARSFAAEYPAIWGGSLDLESSASSSSSDKKDDDEEARRAWAALRGCGGEDRLALRAGDIHVARLARAEGGTDRAKSGGERSLSGTWIVTGGLGGLGLAVARRLAQRGARSLFLLSRRAPDAALETSLAALRATGVRVATVRGDVASPADVEALCDAVAAAGDRLEGIVHAAGVLDDAAFLDLDDARLAAVARPKVLGARALQDALARRGWASARVLLFSSIAGLLGSAGQAAYAAANAALDAMAVEARRRGERWTSIQWGPWSEAGMAARLGDAHRRRLEARGLRSLTDERALAIFDLVLNELLLDADVSLSAETAVVAAFDADWPRLASEARAGGRFPLVADLVESRADAATVEPEASLFDRWQALSPGERDAFVLRSVQDQVMKALGLGPDRRPEPEAALGEYGVDSMIATELRNRFARTTGVEIPVAGFIDGSGAGALARRVADAFAVRAMMQGAQGGLTSTDEIEIEI